MTALELWTHVKEATFRLLSEPDRRLTQAQKETGAVMNEVVKWSLRGRVN